MSTTKTDSMIEYIQNNLNEQGLMISELQISSVISEFYEYQKSQGFLNESLELTETDLIPYFSYKRDKLLKGEPVYEIGIGTQYLDSRRNSRFKDTDSDAREFVSILKCTLDENFKKESEDIINEGN